MHCHRMSCTADSLNLWPYLSGAAEASPRSTFQIDDRCLVTVPYKLLIGLQKVFHCTALSVYFWGQRRLCAVHEYCVEFYSGNTGLNIWAVLGERFVVWWSHLQASAQRPTAVYRTKSARCRVAHQPDPTSTGPTAWHASHHCRARAGQGPMCRTSRRRAAAPTSWIAAPGAPFAFPCEWDSTIILGNQIQF